MFLSHVHSFRGFAIIGIVAAHAVQSFAWDDSSLAYRCLDTLFNQSSIWFFFIAGLLFHHLSGKFAFPAYLRGKLLNVILPYLVLSIPAISVALFLIPQDDVPAYFHEYSLLEQILVFLYTGKHLAPFWFVPAISLIYLLAPLLLKLDKSKTWYYFLPVLLLCSAWLGREGIQGLTHSPLLAAPISKAIYLLPVYILGMFCSRYHSEVLEWTRRFLVPLSGLAIALFGLNLVYYGEQHFVVFLFKLVTCPLALLALLRFDAQVKSKLFLLGDLSFGIFFVHGYVLAAISLALQAVFQISDFPASILGYWVFVPAVTAVCTLSLLLCRQLFGVHSRRIVGC